MQRGAIILCGGKSSRMGRDKATLPFGPELMLQRIVRLLGQSVDLTRIVVVAAPEQQLPLLPGGIVVVYDLRPDRGPLEGLAAGLIALEGRADAAYVTSCDVPLLQTGFVDHMFQLLGDHDIAVPRENEFPHPLAAVYRTSVLASIRRLLDTDRLRLRFLFDEVNTQEIPVEELRKVDPLLETLMNLNRPEDYHQALVAAGFASAT